MLMMDREEISAEKVAENHHTETLELKDNFRNKTFI